MKILNFRKIRNGDIKKILVIYNYHIKNGLGNFEEKEVDYDIFFKFVKKIENLDLPFVVCEHNKDIIGFAYLNSFRNKSGYRFTFENSIYVDNKFTGKGVGSKLLENLLKVSEKYDKIKTIIAIIGDRNNKSSIKIHKKNGFNYIGTLKKVGFKNGNWVDSIYMQKIINEKN